MKLLVHQYINKKKTKKKREREKDSHPLKPCAQDPAPNGLSIYLTAKDFSPVFALVSEDELFCQANS